MQEEEETGVGSVLLTLLKFGGNITTIFVVQQGSTRDRSYDETSRFGSHSDDDRATHEDRMVELDTRIDGA